MSLIQENSNDASFLSASKWEVSDNEARMGEFDEDPIGRDKSVGKWTNADKKLFQPSWMEQQRKSRAD